jgi:hypothetical protein
MTLTYSLRAARAAGLHAGMPVDVTSTVNAPTRRFRAKKDQAAETEAWLARM